MGSLGPNDCVGNVSVSNLKSDTDETPCDSACRIQSIRFESEILRYEKARTGYVSFRLSKEKFVETSSLCCARAAAAAASGALGRARGRSPPGDDRVKSVEGPASASAPVVMVVAVSRTRCPYVGRGEGRSCSRPSALITAGGSSSRQSEPVARRVSVVTLAFLAHLNDDANYQPLARSLAVALDTPLGIHSSVGPHRGRGQCFVRSFVRDPRVSTKCVLQCVINDERGNER